LKTAYKGNTLKTSIKPPKPPAHISNESKKWFAAVLDDYALEPHELKLLILACEAFDRATSAREKRLLNAVPITMIASAVRANIQR
jgi:hypothetical protein